MLNREAIERAVGLQQRGYELLRWMAEAVPASAAAMRHGALPLPILLRTWLTRHHAEVPVLSRPDASDVTATANLLASYLESTFDFDPAPGQRLYSPDAHCFCPMCSWMVEMPRLRPRTLAHADKVRAHKLRLEAVRVIAFEAEVTIGADAIAEIVDEPALREAVSLVAYARDLLRRLDGLPTTAASLALWRGFAWTAEGSPRKRFALTSKAIVAAEQTLIARLRAPR